LEVISHVTLWKSNLTSLILTFTSSKIGRAVSQVFENDRKSTTLGLVSSLSNSTALGIQSKETGLGHGLNGRAPA
jgi:hypothetical protein